LTLINTRLKPSEVAYILEHSGSCLILVDYEYTHLVPPETKVPVIVSKDTGRAGDPYEDFLSQGRSFSGERYWGGLDAEPDENAGAVLCYTYDRLLFLASITYSLCFFSSSGTTGRVRFST
jgi:hypothetical protein